MSMKAFAVALATLTATSAMADGHTGADLYGFGYLGASSLNDPTFSGTVGGAPQTVETFFDDTGTSFGVGIGRALPNFGAGVRGEIELSYSTADIENTNFSGNGPDQEPASGSVDTTRLFASLYKDFDTGSAITPYIGAGLGIASSDLNIAYGPGVTLNDTDRNVTAQIVLGGSYDLTDQLALTTDLRFTRDFGVTSARLNPAGNLTGVVSDDIDTTSLNVGLRFSF